MLVKWFDGVKLFYLDICEGRSNEILKIYSYKQLRVQIQAEKLYSAPTVTKTF